MRSLFLYSNPLDFGQPEYSGFGAGEQWSDDEYIRRYLEIGGNDVKRYRQYGALRAGVANSLRGGDTPIVLFCIGASEKDLRSRLQNLVETGTSRLLVYLAENADTARTRREAFEAGAHCCWNSAAFPERHQLELLCATDRLPYILWDVHQTKLPPRGQVFVACSYDRRLNFEYWVRKGLELCGLEARFADDHATARGARGVNHQTIEQIKQSHLVIAIMDEPYNCNAVYEIGIADAFEIPAIVYQQQKQEQKASDLPVDIRERVHDRFASPEDLGYRLHHGLRDAVQKFQAFSTP